MTLTNQCDEGGCTKYQYAVMNNLIHLDKQHKSSQKTVSMILVILIIGTILIALNNHFGQQKYVMSGNAELKCGDYNWLQVVNWIGYILILLILLYGLISNRNSFY